MFWKLEHFRVMGQYFYISKMFKLTKILYYGFHTLTNPWHQTTSGSQSGFTCFGFLGQYIPSTCLHAHTHTHTHTQAHKRNQFATVGMPDSASLKAEVSENPASCWHTTIYFKYVFKITDSLFHHLGRRISTEHVFNITPS